MRFVSWGIQFLIPLVVLYTIGYYIPGFSALTIPWIVLLALLILLSNRFILWAIGGVSHRFGRVMIDFLAAAVIIFSLTLAIDGGNVPLAGALLAAFIIAGLTELVYYEKVK